MENNQNNFNTRWFNGFNSPLYYEKKAVRKSSNLISFALIGFSVFAFLFQIVLVILSQALKLEWIMEFISTSVGNCYLNIILTLIGFLGIGIFIIKSQKRNVLNLISFKKPSGKKLVPIILTGLGMCYVGNIVVDLLGMVLMPIIEIKQPEFNLPTGFFGVILGIFTTAVFPAILEEFLFRGAIMGSLIKFGKPLAIFISAFLFGLFHGNLIQIPFAFIVGLILGYAVIATNSIWPGVIIHFINNLISVVLEYTEMAYGAEIISGIYMIIMGIVITLGIFGMFWLAKIDKDFLKFEKTPHISTSKKRFTWFVGSVGCIFFIIFCLIDVISVQLLF